MDRKKWTPKSEVTSEVLKFREKRKWQLAFRRYVLEKHKSTSYARFFGLDIEQFRKWIAIQFTEGIHWENFGSVWQFEHIVPVNYFDFSVEEDLVLCWSFINIRVESMPVDKKGVNRIDLIAVKPYFEALYKKTGFSLCLKMATKISDIQQSSLAGEPQIEEFLIKNIEKLETISSFSTDEFYSLNSGMSFRDILLQREIIKKFS